MVTPADIDADVERVRAVTDKLAGPQTVWVVMWQTSSCGDDVTVCATYDIARLIVATWLRELDGTSAERAARDALADLEQSVAGRYSATIRDDYISIDSYEVCQSL